tara:strand:- start:4316 stop:4996 length:681 start_codon:yes stop_codon:yes gene_type:complete
MRYSIIFITSILFFSYSLSAKLIIEPYLGVEYDKWSYEETTSVGHELNLSGNGYGPIYGVKSSVTLFSFLHVGIQYTGNQLDWVYGKDDSTSVDDNWTDITANRTMYGPYIGLHFKKGKKGKDLYRLWFTYGVSDQLSFDQGHKDTESNAILYKGKTFMGGIGRIIGSKSSSIFLNIEFGQTSYTQREENGVTIDLPGTSNSNNYKSLKNIFGSINIGLNMSFFKK